MLDVQISDQCTHFLLFSLKIKIIVVIFLCSAAAINVNNNTTYKILKNSVMFLEFKISVIDFFNLVDIYLGQYIYI